MHFYKDCARLQEGKVVGSTIKKHFLINLNITFMFIDEQEDEEDDFDLIVNFQKHLESEDNMSIKSETDIYMSDVIERTLVDNFDILQW